MRDLLTPKQVAQAIGVSESSLKRWCDKGLLHVQRTAGGHRRLTAQSVLAFLRETGQTVARADLLGLPSNVGRGELVIARARDEALDALLVADEDRFRRVVFDLYLARRPIWELGDKILGWSMERVGHQWEYEHLEVYRERLACQIALRALHELRAVMPTPPEDAPTALGGTPEGDPYQLATTLVELTLREQGWRARSLGSSLPIDTLCAAVRDHRPCLVWLSVSHVQDRARFVAQFAQLHAAAAELGRPLVVGGRALDDAVRGELQYTAFCDSLQHVVSTAAAFRPAPIA